MIDFGIQVHQLLELFLKVDAPVFFGQRDPGFLERLMQVKPENVSIFRIYEKQDAEFASSNYHAKANLHLHIRKPKFYDAIPAGKRIIILRNLKSLRSHKRTRHKSSPSTLEDPAD